MKAFKYTLAFILMAGSMHLIYAQGKLASRTFNGISYYQLSGEWQYFDPIDQTFRKLSHNVVSLKLPDTVTSTQIQNLENAENLTLLRMAETGWADFSISPPNDLLDRCEQLDSLTLVHEVEVSMAPESLKWPSDSTMEINSITGEADIQWGIGITETDKAWDITTGDTNVVIAVIDNGINWWVDDFQQASNTTRPFWVNDGEDPWADPNVPGGNGIDDDGNGYVDDWRGWNFVSGNNDVRDGQPWNHGTGVASIATARTHNTIGMAGVAGGWGNAVGAKTMILKVRDSSASPADMGAAADDAILYAAKHGASIINISMAWFSNKSSISEAIERAYSKYNVAITAGSGNDTGTTKPVRFPANHPYVLGTAVTNNNDRTQASHTGPKLDLGAPGISPILNADTNGNLIQISGGTSLASPFVAGAAALMYSINPCISADEATNILRRRADKVNAFDISSNQQGYKYYDDPLKPGHAELIGYGRVNTNRAVKTAQKHASSSLDLYIKDHYSDFGYNQSYPDTARFDDWSEIWVRNQPDGRTNREMDEIEYTSSSPAYVYVRVRNKSCTTSTGNDSVGVYWSKASSGTSWPQNWDGSQPNIGDVIAETAIPPLPPGADTILEFPWTISPEPLQSWGT